MQLIARRGDQVDLALVPIGGHYTMDRFDAVTACEFINPSQVIPCHYGTFPLVAGTPEELRQLATGVEVHAIDPGESLEL